MKTGRFLNGWTLVLTLLVLIIIAGGIIIFINGQNSPGITITLTTPEEIKGQIYIGGGGVNNPGIYPLYSGDSFEDIVRAAGGIKDGADPTMIELTFISADEGRAAQKININRAEAWLLEALPGIGEVKAQEIIKYREQNGLFQDINELMKVPGFGDIMFEKVKDFITVYD
jgi:competence protein ComEA